MASFWACVRWCEATSDSFQGKTSERALRLLLRSYCVIKMLRDLWGPSRAMLDLGEESCQELAVMVFLLQWEVGHMLHFAFPEPAAPS